MILIINLSTKFSTPQNVLAFAFKRPCVFPKTSLCFVSNVEAFWMKHKGPQISVYFCFRIY